MYFNNHFMFSETKWISTFQYFHQKFKRLSHHTWQKRTLPHIDQSAHIGDTYYRRYAGAD